MATAIINSAAPLTAESTSSKLGALATPMISIALSVRQECVPARS
jgi:hypothetical protein